MEKSKQSPEGDFAIARVLMVLDQFERVAKLIGDTATVVPVKGIALLRSIYAGTFDRNVGDIDLVVHPAEALPEVVDKMISTGDYRLEFDFMADPAIMMAKRKVSLLSNSPRLVDIDIHTGFITKKFFRRSTGAFDEDAFKRLRPAGGNVMEMDPVDQWLFLAQHACFHQFSNHKWLLDLKKLLDSEPGAPCPHAVVAAASRYGLKRVVYASRANMVELFGEDNVNLPQIDIGRAPLFKRFSRRWHRQRHNKIARQLGKVYYEFVHIDRRSARWGAYMAMTFPSLSIMSNIYRKASTLGLIALYPAHVALSLASLLAFHLRYLRG